MLTKPLSSEDDNTGSLEEEEEEVEEDDCDVEINSGCDASKEEGGGEQCLPLGEWCGEDLGDNLIE